MLVGWISVGIVIFSCAEADSRTRCREHIIESHLSSACSVIERPPWELESSEVTPCKEVSPNKTSCLSHGCCWYKDGCYQKPGICYVDLRKEQCPERSSESPHDTIYAGYTLNGTYCYVETAASYISTLTSYRGARTLDDNEDPCVIRKETVTTRNASGICTSREDSSGVKSGTISFNKCVLREGGVTAIRDFGNRNSCVCNLDAWVEDANSDATGVSQEIHDLATVEESQSTCARILGRIFRNSWRRHVEITSTEEADMLLRGLVNVTEQASSTMKVKDVEILLDTSSQLSKYKFYGGLDNRTADLLIKSSTKFISNLLKTALVHASPSVDVAHIAKRSMDLQDSPLLPDDSKIIRWKIMKNLEEITENIAFFVEMTNKSSYVVEAREDAVDLKVAIASNENRHSLIHTDNETATSSNRSWSAFVTEISEQEQGDRVAVITAYYDMSRTNVTNETTRESGVLAINPLVLDNQLVGDRLSLPVVFTLPVNRQNRKLDGRQYLCSYREESTDDRSYNKWLETGCEVKDASNVSVTCECNHTTHFAVLLQLHHIEIPTKHITTLEYISISMGSLSAAALAVTIIVFISYRHILLTHRTAIHLNLAISMLGGYLALLLGSIFSSRHLDHPKACFGFSIASHLFFLSTFFWFLMEGIYLFYKVVMVFSTKWGECGAKYAPLLGWGAPLLIVVISVLASRRSEYQVDRGDPYYDDSTCFLQTANGAHWTFVGPALAITSINLFILGKVVMVIFRSSRSSSTKGKTLNDSLRASAKGAIILLPILGVPWIVNMFSGLPPPAGIVASYVHTVLVGIQGMAIFLFYCVFNSEVRKAFKITSERRRSLASIEVATKNARKRSHTPLLISSNGSTPIVKHKNSLTLSTTGRTYTVTSQISGSNGPPSPNPANGGLSYLPPLNEHSR